MAEKTKRFFHSIFRSFIGAGLFQIFILVIGLVFTASNILLISQFLASNITFVNNYKALFIIISSSGGIWLFVWLFYKFRRNRPNFPTLDLDFRVLSREITYEYKNKKHMHYTKKVFVQALKNNLDRYIDKYAWTGKGSIKMKSNIKEQLCNEGLRKNVWQFYEIIFQKILNKGDKIETEIFWDLYDKESVAVPFASSTVLEPTELLKLKVILPQNFDVREAICETSCSISSYRPLKTEYISCDRNGVYEWNIIKPKILYHYEMRWIFPKSN